MTRRSIGYALIALLILAGAVLLIPAVRYPLMGRIHGEKFIDGYPVSYWIMEASQPVADPKAILLLGQSGPEAVPVLLRHALDESNLESEGRANAAKALIELGPSARSAVPELIHVIVKDGSKTDRSPAYYAARKALTGLGPNAVDATPLLIPLLQSIHHTNDAAVILAAIGPGAKAAISSLTQALEQEQRGSTSDSLCVALASVGAGEEAVPAILDAFSNAYANANLEQALTKMHRAGVPVIPHAIKALGSKHARVRQGAAGALAALGPEAREAIPALEKLTMDENEHVRYAAAEALKKIKATAP